jgi:diguanylate cyclase (GGDEF)-like protein/PAS domain S-box-containing protein
VIEWDPNFCVTTWNPSAEKIFGYSQEDVAGASAHKLLVGPDALAAIAKTWTELLKTKASTRIMLTTRTKSGTEIETDWYNTVLVDADKSVVGFTSLVQDVTERLNHERTIHHMAHHDALTGLPNRRLMQERLNEAIMQARRAKTYVGVLFINLDRFKLINDTLGHDTGDHVLRDVAKRLAALMHQGDTVSRDGGDEFMVIVNNLATPDDAKSHSAKILRELAKPIEIAGHELTVTASIGIAHYPNDATDVQQLLKLADTAMSEAKDAGRNTSRIHTGDVNFLLSKRLDIESRLRRAIDRGEFFLRYQPQMDVVSGRIVGTEALLRWNEPSKGEVLPSEFIPVAEELGLIVPLGEWVFRTACQQLQEWDAAGLPQIVMSVNVSPRQFVAKRLLPSMIAALAETGVDARRIDLEITETVAMRNLEQSIVILGELRRVGASISIDDFGVGYSSLAQLKRLSAQTLKIDQSFISQIPHDADSCSITEAIIAMAKRLQLRVVAEGVETAAQLAFLRENHCDIAQGYLIGKPLKADEMAAMLAAAPRDVDGNATATPR